MKRFLHFVELEWLDNRLDFFHERFLRRIVRGNSRGTQRHYHLPAQNAKQIDQTQPASHAFGAFGRGCSAEAIGRPKNSDKERNSAVATMGGIFQVVPGLKVRGVGPGAAYSARDAEKLSKNAATFGGKIESAGGFVQQQDFGVGQKGFCEDETLFHSAR